MFTIKKKTKSKIHPNIKLEKIDSENISEKM